MSKTIKMPQKPVPCYQCKELIKFVKKKGGKSIRVEPQSCYFLPATEGHGEKFISPNGTVRYGTPASDGLVGYREHDCPYVKKKSA